MSPERRYLLIFVILTGQMTLLCLAQGYPNDYLNHFFFCPENGSWDYLSSVDRNGFPTAFCFTVVSARSFENALTHCHLQQAELLSLQNAQSSYFTSDGKTLTDLLASNGVRNVWSGYYVRDGRLRNDTFPMCQERGHYYAPILYSNMTWYSTAVVEEPSGTSDCFESAMIYTPSPNCSLTTSSPVTAGQGSRFETSSGHSTDDDQDDAEDDTEDDIDYSCGGNWASRVRSRSCNDALPFVCVRTAGYKQTSLYPVDRLCDVDEYGNYAFSRCFSYVKQSVNYTTAQSGCARQGQMRGKPRTLYQPASSSFLDGLIVDLIIRSNGSGLPENATAWVDGGGQSDVQQCLALILDPGFNATVARDCAAKLPYYVCQSSVYLPGAENLTIEVDNVDKNLSTVIPGSNDTQVTIPYQLTTQIPIIQCSYGSEPVPGLQSMSLMKGGIPIVAQQFNFLRYPLWNENYRPLSDNITDYYWCEINDLKTGKIHQSHRIFIRRKEVEMYTASANIKLSNIISPYNVRPSSLTLESLTGLDVYSVSQRISSLLMQNQTSFFYRVLRLRSDELTARSNSSAVDFYFFMRHRPGEFKPTSALLRNASNILFFELERVFTNDFNYSSFQIRSIDICASTIREDPVSNKTYLIPDLNLGETFHSPDICLANGQPYVTLRCQGDKLYGAVWSQFWPNQGCNFSSAAWSAATTTLKRISESAINSSTRNDTISDTEEVFSQLENFTALDIVYFADIVQNLAGVEELSAEDAGRLLDLVDRTTQLDSTVLEDSNGLGNATNRIIRAIGDLGDNLAFMGNPMVQVLSEYTALEVWNLSQVTDDKLIIGLKLKMDGMEPAVILSPQDLISLFRSDAAHSDTDAAILLPQEFIQEVRENNPGRNLRLSMNVFIQTVFFKLGELDQEEVSTTTKVSLTSAETDSTSRPKLNSKVISAKVTVDGISLTDLKGSQITVVYFPLVTQSNANNSICVFWDFAAAGGRGGWSDEGCWYNQTLHGRDVCVCDHLTNFAVLLDLYGQSDLPQNHQFALSVITIIGLSLSITGLSITVLSFLLIKKLRHGKPQQTLFNMALALLASWIIFLAGFTRADSHVGCLVVAALLHYFILAAFMWMLMEGVLQYLLFVKVLPLSSGFHKYMLRTSVPAWGLPLIPVIVVLAVDVELYHGGNRYCWMALTPFYYAFLLPVVLVIVTNVVVYIMVVVNICRRGKINSSSTKHRAVSIRASVACFIVLGLSWIFAFFAVDDARVVFEYLFTITSTLQGFLVFLIFTARDPAVRDFWRQTCCSWKKRLEVNKNTRTPPTLDRQQKHTDETPLSRSALSSNPSANARQSGLSNRTVQNVGSAAAGRLVWRL